MAFPITQGGHNKFSAVAEMGDRLATIDIGQKLGAVPLWGVSWVPTQHNVAWAEAYLDTKWHLDPSSRLAIIVMGQKLGVLPPFLERELGPYLTQCCFGRGLSPYQVAS